MHPRSRPQPLAAFVLPSATTPLTTSSFTPSTAVCPSKRISQPTAPRMALPLHKLLSNSDDNPLRPLPSWARVGKAVRLSTLSLSLLLTSTLTPFASRSASFSIRPPHSNAATASAAVKDTSATGDAEAAAMTLGAVTIGGLVMRAIVHSRKDAQEEQRRVEAECKRLADQENERIRRAKRKKMEAVETTGLAPDADLMSDFRKRVQTLSDNPSSESDDVDPDSTKDDNMRHTPIPDRGTGSMLLERPDDESPITGSDEDDSDLDQSQSSQGSAADMEKPANPDELEMLKRMWNMSSPDKE